MWYSFINRLKASFGLADVVDILVVAFLVYEAIILVRKTRTAQLAKGIIALLLVWAVASFAHLRTLQFILDNLMSWGLIALVIVFQPELRRALEQVGNTNILSAGFLRPRARGASLRQEWRKAALAVCDAAERFSDTRTGALMVFEKRSNLSEIIKTGTVLDSEVTQEMLGTIFYVGTPLHDGAAILRDGRIAAAGCVLPLSDNLEMGKDMGTRHRAALGMSENSDAVVVVVSEETGIISLAKNGVLIRRLDRQTLFSLLEGDVVPPAEEEKKQPFWSFWRKKHE